MVIELNINTYIDNLVTECLELPIFYALDEDQIVQVSIQLKEYFYFAVAEIVFNRLSDTQLKELKNLPPEDPLLEEKLEEALSEIPFLAKDIEERLDRDFEIIRQTAMLPTSFYHRI